MIEHWVKDLHQPRNGRRKLRTDAVGKTPVEIPLHLEHILSPHQKLFHFPVGKLHDNIMSGTGLQQIHM